MSIFKFLGLDQRKYRQAQSSAETETVRKITAELDELPPERAKFIASFAYILSRVARADLTISPEENREMERIVMQRAGLPEAQAIIVVQIAKTQSILFGGTENYLVTREFNNIATREEKLALLDCLFAVSSADRSVSAVEDTEISQIASELKIEHRDFIAIRSSYRDRLAVLQKPPDT